MRRLSLALAAALSSAAASPANADVGSRLTTTVVAVGGAIHGEAYANPGTPFYLVPERQALRPYSCRDRTAFCTPQVKDAPAAPFVLLGRASGPFSFRVPGVSPGRYRVVLWCRPCGGSLVLAGSTMDGQVVTILPGRVRERVDLVAPAQERLGHCLRAPLLRSICPRRVPRVRAPYLSHLATDLLGSRRLAVFGLERGGEHPREPERNRPPAMAHLVVARGHVRQLAPVWRLGVRRVDLRDGLMHEARPHLLRFEPVRWGGRKAWLELAPAHPRGGMLGNHLMVRWGPPRDERLVSLHAWEPLTEAAHVLRLVVESLPPRDARFVARPTGSAP